MRIAYLDCFAGIAGDMFLGALIDGGVPAEVLHRATSALNLGATLKIETVDRSGISCTKVHVLEHGELADRGGVEQSQTPEHTHTHDSFQHQAAPSQPAYTRQPETQHLHKGGHAHEHTHEPSTALHTHEDAPVDAHSHNHDNGHSHTHAHGRSLTAIRTLILAAPLDPAVKALALRTFELLGASEAKIHNVPVDEIHFHEVGAVDAIVDIVASCAGIHHLRIGAWHSSPVNVGGGMVVCAHGTFPVPAPATADLLRGFPTYSAHVQKELVTPTGAALLRALQPAFGQQPAMSVETIGYGAGARNPKDFPNVLRLSTGDSTDAAGESKASQLTEGSVQTGENAETVHLLETALDDLSPQVIAYVAEKALAAGALDVMLTPVVMKKGRPGTLMTVLCSPALSSPLQELLLRETSTLGIRIREEKRICLDRSFSTLETAYGPIRIKIGSASGEERNIAPEYEDCRAAALQHAVPLKQVQQAAIAAYRQ